MHSYTASCNRVWQLAPSQSKPPFSLGAKVRHCLLSALWRGRSEQCSVEMIRSRQVHYVHFCFSNLEYIWLHRSTLANHFWNETFHSLELKVNKSHKSALFLANRPCRRMQRRRRTMSLRCLQRVLKLYLQPTRCSIMFNSVQHCSTFVASMPINVHQWSRLCSSSPQNAAQHSTFGVSWVACRCLPEDLAPSDVLLGK